LERQQRSLQERLSALPVVEDAPQLALARDAVERAQAVHQACQLQARHAHEEQLRLVARMEHYFRKLFPQADLTLGEQLTLSGLTRDGAAAEPEHLSFGTQEQIGLLGRFAYADLLREAGLPTLLIVDDAVVHTDAEIDFYLPSRALGRFT
jgi:uncharacterized protein YhaN